MLTLPSNLVCEMDGTTSKQKEGLDVLESMFNKSDDYQIDYEWSTALVDIMEPIEFVCEDIVHMNLNINKTVQDKSIDFILDNLSVRSCIISVRMAPYDPTL